MLGHSKPFPKLKSYGAETRGLIPVMKDLVLELLHEADPVEQCVKQTSLHLATCYDCLSSSAPFAADRMAENCRRFCTLYVGLAARLPRVFHVKPKLHLFQELCEMELPGQPSTHWTYREEEFGGSIAQMGRRLGGAHTAVSTGHQVLNKFCARHKVPEI